MTEPIQFESAIIIVAPHTVQAVAVPIMRQHLLDELLKVPPHITLLYPFAPFEKLYEASQTVRRLCAEIAPLEITLSGYGQFPGVIYMNPINPEPIKSVFRKLYAAFPEYPPYKGQYGDDLHPHLTIAQFEDEADQRAAASALPGYAPLTFQVTHLHILYGAVKAALPWIAYDVIPLGANLRPGP